MTAGAAELTLLATTLPPSRNCSNEPDGVFVPFAVMTSLEYCAI